MGVNSMSHEKHEHWAGFSNKVIRYFFYLFKGLEVFNNFKYLIGAILAGYYVLKLDQPVVLLVIFLVCLPVLGIVGYYWVHRAGPVMDWLNISFGTYWSKKSMDWQERQVKAVEEIRDCVAHPMRIYEPNVVKSGRANRGVCAEGDQLKSTQAYEASGQEISPIEIDKSKIGVY